MTAYVRVIMLAEVIIKPTQSAIPIRVRASLRPNDYGAIRRFMANA
jgi:hypothetical protein